MTTRSRRPVLQNLVVATAIALVGASCGDDGGAIDTGAPGSETSAPNPAGDDGSATVSIGIESFDFDQELVCIALGGAVSGSFRNDEGLEVSIDVPPEDWETSTTGDWNPPSLTLRDERDELNWRIFEANVELGELHPGTRAGEAVITDFAVDGAHSTGNGMAIDTWAIALASAEGNAVPEPVPLTFGFDCS